jgi:magnesium transporter
MKGKNMSRRMKSLTKQPGLPPGELIHLGERKTKHVRISVFDYNEKSLLEKDISDLSEVSEYLGKKSVTWLNINGLHEIKHIEAVGKIFNVHSLVLEDVLNTNQRPKVEEFDDYLYVVVKMLSGNADGNGIDTEQVSLILGKNYVISLQEKEGDLFDPVRDRIRTMKGRIRKMGADFLMYSLVDAIVDHYFFILENIGTRINDLEEIVLSDPTPVTLQQIHKLKRDVIYLRKTIWPTRDMTMYLPQMPSSLISDDISIFLRDLYDHVMRVNEAIETYRDMITAVLDIYLTTINNRMNEVMKVLTIISTIFIPLSFFAGIYGMNFDFMPELHYKWGYYILLFAMMCIAGAMMLFFRKKRWF